MYDIYYGLKLWKKNKLAITILIVGFASFISILYITLLSTFVAFNDKPDWVHSNNNFITIANQGNNGSLKPANFEQLTQLTTIKDISSYEYVGKFYDTEFIYNEKTIKVPVYLYSPNFFNFLGVNGFKNIAIPENTAILNKAFIQQYVKNTEQLPAYISTKKTSKSYHLFTHYLPAQMEVLGNSSQPAIWLPMSALKDILKVNFNIPIPEEQLAMIKKTLADKTSVFFSIATTNQNTNIFTIKKALDKSTEATANDDFKVSIIDNKQSLTVTKGIDFYPEQTQKLQQLAKLGLLLTLLLGCAVLLNFFSYNFSSIIRRQDEFSLRISIGATKKTIVHQLFKEQLPLTLLLVFAVSLLLFFIHAELLNYYSQYFAQYPNIQLINLSIALGFLLLVVAIGIITPFILINKKQFFTRSKSKTLSQKQQLLLKVNNAAQIITALIFITISILMMYDYWQKKHSFNLNFNLYEVRLINNNSSLSWKSLQAKINQYFDKNKDQIALLSSPILEPNNPTLNASKTSVKAIERHYLMSLFVTPSFFDLLAIPSVNINKNNGFIYLNNTAKKYLKLQNNKNEFLYIKDNFLENIIKDKPMIISGFIDDIPHLGFGKRSPNMAYIDYQYSPQILNSSITLLYSPSIKGQMKTFLAMLQDKIGHNLKIEHLGKLETRFNQLNHKHNILLNGIFIFTVFICSMVGLSIYALIQTDFYANRIKYGVWLATGMSWNLLYIKILSSILITFILATTLWLGLLQLLATWLIEILQIMVIQKKALLLSFIFSLFITLIALIIPFLQSKKKSITEMLKDFEE